MIKTQALSTAKTQMGKIRTFMSTYEAKEVRREQEAKIMLNYMIFRNKEIRKVKKLTSKKM
jgi:hypothetical protein